jgi:hypothetical protein
MQKSFGRIRAPWRTDRAIRSNKNTEVFLFRFYPLRGWPADTSFAKPEVMPDRTFRRKFPRRALNIPE